MPPPPQQPQSPMDDPLFLALMTKGQTGKKTVFEAKKAAIEGFNPPKKSDPGWLDSTLPGSWDTLAKAQGLTTYFKNNLFYFGQKGDPPDITWL